jgi:sulfur carrier protein
MLVIVNGKETRVADNITVLRLIEDLRLQPDATVVERNAAIVDRGTYGSVVLTDGDTIELVRLVGGG